MRHILGRAGRSELTRLAATRPLLAFDFDGTLAPIVSDPDNAALPPSTRSLLASLAALFPCAIVSGRSLDDLERRLEGVPLAFVVGNHGAEWRPSHEGSEGVRGRVRGWRERLVVDLEGLDGVEIEDKGWSLAVHYRRAPDLDRAQSAILTAVGRLERAKGVAGLAVVNVVATDAPHKGDALIRVTRSMALAAALFVGDDITDEDAFAASSVQPIVAVRVGRARWSRAGWYVRDQAEVDDLLRLLCLLGERLRSGPRAHERLT